MPVTGHMEQEAISVLSGATTLSIITLCHYGGWHNAECRVLFIIMLNVVMLSVVMLSVVVPAGPTNWPKFISKQSNILKWGACRQPQCPGINVTKLVSSLLTLMINKLEFLAPGNFFQASKTGIFPVNGLIHKYESSLKKLPRNNNSRLFDPTISSSKNINNSGEG